MKTNAFTRQECHLRGDVVINIQIANEFASMVFRMKH